MKKGVHPEYRKVLFLDTSTGDEWTAYSTLSSSDTKAHEGEELTLLKVEISAKSHPFWTGQARSVDAEGRIDRFRRRYAKGKAAKKAAEPEVAAEAAPVEETAS
ncbi:MAG: type B 50S ribosomal protein L31 [Nannocystaceae bacterium]|nr:type B 50S ribosomal protein L31 [Nannocystaceae bacterium]